MSGVPSTPFTPGRDSASTSRSSRSTRSPMANGRLPAASAPRAGWSAAIIISRPCDTEQGGGPAALGRGLGDRRGPLDPGGDQVAEEVVIHGLPPASSILGLDLVHSGHRVGARQPPRDDRTGGVAEPHAPLQVPSSEKGVTQRAAERVARAEAVDDVDRHRRHLDVGLAVVGEHALRALLDDRQRDPPLVQRPRRGVRLALADGGLALVEVADRDVDVGQRLLDPLAGLLAGGPEHRPVVQVEDGVAAAGPGPQRGQRGLAAGLLGQAGDRDPEDLRVADRVEVELVGVDLHVRRARAAVEVQREVVGREDLAEGHGRRQVRHRGDVAVVHAEALQRVVQELAERVGPGAGDDRAAAAEPGGGDGHVGRAAAEELAEALHVAQRGADLQGVDVDPHPPDREHLVGCGRRGHRCISLSSLVAVRMSVRNRGGDPEHA